MKKAEIRSMYDLSQTLASKLFDGKVYPWEVLPEIGEFLVKLGETLDPAVYERRGESVWIARSAKIYPAANICGSCIIGENTEVRPGAFIRGNAIVGSDCVVGNSTELKNVVLFNHVQVPHYNYVGDSVLGYFSHMGAGSITSNVKSDKTLVVIRDHLTGEAVETGRKKVGAFLGNHVEVGCNSVLNPGTVICPDSNVYPLSSVRGVIGPHCIYKDREHVVEKA